MPKPTRADYAVTAFQVVVLLVAGFYALVYQNIWKLTFEAHQQSKKLKTKSIKRVATRALHSISKPLAVNSAGNRIEADDLDDLELEVNLAKREKCMKVINGANALHTAMRRCFHKYNPFWKRHMFWEVDPEELNRSTHVYMGNHSSFADFVFLCGTGVNITAVGKSDLLKIPIGGRILQNAGILPVYFKRRNNGKWTTDKEKTKVMLADAVDYLEFGVSVLVFPEGTINTEYGLTDFKPGFFNVARAANVDIVPFAIWGAPKVWPMASKSVPRMPMSYGHCYIKVGKPMQLLEPEGTALFNSMENLFEFVEEQYEMTLSAELDPEGFQALGEMGTQIVEMNQSESNTNDEYTELVHDFFQAVVRRKVFEMRCEMEAMANEAAEKKKK